MNYCNRLIFYILFFSFSFYCSGQTIENSVLSAGKWYRFKVNTTGIYKITYDDLKELGFEAPENIRIYGNGGGQLSFLNNKNNLEDLQEVPICQFKGDDGVFGSGDYYLFYGEGVVSWNYSASSKMFMQHIHNYALSNYYFITASFGEGKRVKQVDYSSNTPYKTVQTYLWRDYVENEVVNLGASGRQWFGDRFDDKAYSKSFVAEDIIPDSILKVKINLASRSDEPRQAQVTINDSTDFISFSRVNTENTESTLADVRNRIYSLKGVQKDILVNVKLTTNKYSDRAYIDYITLNACCKLNFSSNPFFFRDIASVKEGAYARFVLSGMNSNIEIWNITDQNNIFEAKGSLNSGNFSFIAPVSSLQEYIALDVTGEYNKPVFTDNDLNDVGWIDNQNLHGMIPPNLLIVTHPLFLKQANELADLHKEKDNLTVQVVTTQQVYNEFSSGKRDASAIRNFARWLYKHSTTNDNFEYMLLVGDGSYDNRTINDINPNYIPTYESEASLDPISTYTTDDFYAMLDSNEWRENGTLDIGVGRLPVYWDKSDEDKIAQGVVDKIISYYNASSMKDWRNQMIFLSDDAEGGDTDFVIDSDQLTHIIENSNPEINITKIYMDAYQQISSSAGASYPEVEKELQRTLNKGALLFNYMGHGGENGITQERVFQKSDIENLKNGPYYPLFITATCQLGRYDNVTIESPTNYSRKISFGEAAILNPYGGAIALFTTTRVVYQSSNFELGTNIYNHIFDKDENHKRLKLGDIFRLSKNNYTGNATNALKFTLLGDPAVTLAYGEYKVITDSINSLPAGSEADTARALGIMSISGHVAYDDSTIINNFNGIVQISVYDKKYSITTNGNDGAPPFTFETQDKLLFHGKASVKGGRFSSSFKLPKDISYSMGNGKISYYAQNDTIDAKGFFGGFYIGGTDPFAETDNDGPDIHLYMNDTNFVEGGITSKNPVLLAYISDKNGINTTGNGIGHDISAILDENTDENYTLNDYFEGDLNSYQSGTAYYQFNDLETGYHSISVKAWDIYNNSSQGQIGFYVENVGGLVLNKLYNYPNPMSSYTYFQYSHNLPGNHDVTLKIYDLSGRLIYSIHRINSEQGFVSEPIYWNRKSNTGAPIPPGVYPYTVDVKVSSDYSNTIIENTENGKLIIIP